jgi:multicomponent K+:H+ antiporter subunit G
MSDAAAVPAWLAIVIALLVVTGAALALIGSIGLLRLRTFYERVHAPTLGMTMGLGLTLLASIAFFSALGSRPVVHEIVIALFMIVTAPVSFTLLVRAARHRDRVQDDGLRDRDK